MRCQNGVVTDKFFLQCDPGYVCTNTGAVCVKGEIRDCKKKNLFVTSITTPSTRPSTTTKKPTTEMPVTDADAYCRLKWPGDYYYPGHCNG